MGALRSAINSITGWEFAREIVDCKNLHTLCNIFQIFLTYLTTEVRIVRIACARHF